MKNIESWNRRHVAVMAMLCVIASLFVSTIAHAIDIGPMTWTPRSDWVNVQNPSAFPGMAGFTAATGNGTTDDTPALQAILTYIQNHYDNPHTIYFPPGTYKITSTLTITNVSGLNFFGCGSNTIISWAGPAGGAMYAPNGSQNMRYVGLVWEGNNTAAVAYESDPQNIYAGGIRIENNSFRDITAPATYTYITDTNGDTGTTPIPPTAAITSGYWGGSYSGETQIWNCRFSNCTEGIAQTWNPSAGNFYCWFVDSCEFDNCPTGINLGFGGGNVVTNCHFQNSTTADILGGGDTHIRHCTSTGSAYFFSDPGSLGNPLDPNVIEDCWVDGWTNPGYAMYFQRAGPTTVFDCTFTNPPSGAGSPIESTSVDIENHLILSNNYAAGLSAGTPLLNTDGQPALVDNVPPGLRFGALTLQSAGQTFLNPAYPADSTHIIDISQAPYASQWTYPNQNGFYPPGVPDITVALQNAVNAAQLANNGSVVYIPSGIYNLSATINASGSNYTIEGNGFSSEVCWWGPDNSSMISITSPQNLAVKNIRLTVQDGETVAGVAATSTTATALTFDDISYGTFQVGNPGAGAQLVDGPGLQLSNLPAGSMVSMPLLYIPLTVQNCGAAQILTRYLAGGGTLAVSGTTPQTGFLGAIFDEGGNMIANDYDITVTDNQDLILGDYYVEQDDSNALLSRGAGTGVGRFTIGGFNTSSGNSAGGSGSQYLVNVNNYAGRVFYGSAGCNNWYAQYPVAVNQAGTNPVDMIFAGMMPDEGFTFTLGAGANLIATQNVNTVNYPGADITDTPNPLTAADYLSMAQGLDHFRQLEAVDLSVQDGITTDGPAIAQYPFEGNVLDMTGNYNGTAHNVTYVPGLGSQAASFDGTSSYVQIPNPVSGSFSIAMWIQTYDLGGTGQWYQGKGLVDGYTAANAADFGTALNGGKFSFGVGSSDTTLTSTNTVDDGNWHHLVATRNATTGALQIYVDGVLNNSVTGPAGTRNAATTLRIGSIQTGASGGFFRGTIDQVQVFNYAVSATDVANLYHRTVSLMPAPAALVAEWKLDETTGTTSYDSSGNNFNGTWMNAPAFTTNIPPEITAIDPGCLSFNGTNQYIDMGNPVQLPSGYAPRTLCGWAKSNGAPSGPHWIASFGSPNNDQAMFIGAVGTTLYGGGFNDDLTVPNFWDGNWHFICLTYDGTTASLYADGVLRASAAKSWNLVQSACFIGKQVYNASEYWPGSIDDVRIYSRCLSASEVSQFVGLVGYWTLDESTGPTAHDSWGNQIDGTWESSPTFTTDHPTPITFPDAGSLTFNGTDQYIDMGNPSQLPSGYAPRSICGWAKSNGAPSGPHWIASFGSPHNDQAMFIGAVGTTLYGGGFNDDLTVPNFWDGNWHFICLTYDGTTANLYADGVLRASAAKSWNLVPSACYIGEQVDNDSEYWQGSIDDVRIYDRCLSPAEVSQMTGLVAEWTLDETTGPTSFDASGNEIDGTWENSPTFTSDRPSPITFADAGSLSFNGTSQYVNFGNPLQLPSGYAPRTLCGWAKSNGAPAGSHWIAAFGSPYTDEAMFIGSVGTSLYGGGFLDDLSVPNFWDGNWHFIALTYDGATAKLYADGVLVASGAKNWNLVPGACYVGEQVDNAAEYWPGTINDVRVYDRVLSAAEISTLEAGNLSP